MKIAVTYENGQVFQHFGHTEAFKLYEIEDGKVVSANGTNDDGKALIIDVKFELEFLSL